MIQMNIYPKFKMLTRGHNSFEKWIGSQLNRTAPNYSNFFFKHLITQT